MAVLLLDCATVDASMQHDLPPPAPASRKSPPAPLRISDPELRVCIRLKDQFKEAAGRCAMELLSGCAIQDDGKNERTPGACPACDEMDALNDAMAHASCA